MKSWMKIGLFILAVVGITGTVHLFAGNGHLHQETSLGYSSTLQKGDIPALSHFLPAAHSPVTLFRTSIGNPSAESIDHKQGAVGHGSRPKSEHPSVRVHFSFRPDARLILRALLYPFHSHW
jgi:hypothetical protein